MTSDAQTKTDEGFQVFKRGDMVRIRVEYDGIEFKDHFYLCKEPSFSKQTTKQDIELFVQRRGEWLAQKARNWLASCKAAFGQEVVVPLGTSEHPICATVAEFDKHHMQIEFTLNSQVYTRSHRFAQDSVHHLKYVDLNGLTATGREEVQSMVRHIVNAETQFQEVPEGAIAEYLKEVPDDPDKDFEDFAEQYANRFISK